VTDVAGDAGVTDLLAQIAGIGRDERSGGYRRYAWTAQDAELGEWFEAACAARGLDVVRDRNGNQWGWWGDPDAGAGEPEVEGMPAAPRSGAVVTGSHLDSVPDGGAFDGPLGVVSALLAVDLLRAKGFEPRRPIAVVRFADEEGARFGLPCAGSRLLTGAADPGAVLALTDASGTTYAEALRAAGVDPDHVGRDEEMLARVGAFVELHVEQGYDLVAVDAPLGAGRLIRPHGRWRVEIAGRADHAGTAPLSERADALLELARLIQTTRSTAARQDALATVGKVEVRPNAVNAVASHVTAWLDVRADTPGQVRSVVGELGMAGFASAEESWSPATVFDDALTAQAAKAAAGAVGLAEPLPGLATGAGHDAGVLALAGVPATMLFVRNPTGVSHSPQEFATPEDCDAGVVGLAAVLADLAS
jgi:N-carbamoyl-L-amino-acid hydrolase